MHNHLDMSTSLDASRSTYAFDFTHVQLAMREHRRPGTGLPLEALVLTELVLRPERGLRCIRTMLASFEAQVVEDQLCLRIQQWLLIPVGYKVPERIDDGIGPSVHFCTHLSLDYEVYFDERRQEEARLGVFAPELCRCPVCEVEYVADIVYMGALDKNALVVSKWLDLGDGLDPQAETWRRHARPAGRVRSARVDIEQTSLMRDFERAHGKSLAQLTSENRRIIDGQTEMVDVSRMELAHVSVGTRMDRTWVLQKDVRSRSWWQRIMTWEDC